MYLTVILTVEKGKGCYGLTAQASIDLIPLPQALGVSRITDGRSSLTEYTYRFFTGKNRQITGFNFFCSSQYVDQNWI